MNDQIRGIQGVVRTPLSPLSCPPYREFVDDMAEHERIARTSLNRKRLQAQIKD